MRKHFILLVLALMLLAPIARAANEIKVTDTASKTVYSVIVTPAGLLYTAGGNVTLNNANWQASVALTEQGTTIFYFGTFPATLPAGRYSVVSFEQAGGAPAATDTSIASGVVDWTGTIVASIGFLPQVAAGAANGVALVGSNMGSVSSVTGGVTVATNNDKTGYSLATAPPTVTQIRQEMDANSTKLGWLTGDAFARMGVAGAGLTALGDTRLANLDVAISSRLAATGYTAPPTITAIAAAILGNGGTVTLSMDASGRVVLQPAQTFNMTGSITGNLSGSVGSLTGYVAPTNADTSGVGTLLTRIGIPANTIAADIATRSTYTSAVSDLTNVLNGAYPASITTGSIFDRLDTKVSGVASATATAILNAVLDSSDPNSRTVKNVLDALFAAQTGASDTSYVAGSGKAGVYTTVYKSRSGATIATLVNTIDSSGQPHRAWTYGTFPN